MLFFLQKPSANSVYNTYIDVFYTLNEKCTHTGGPAISADLGPAVFRIHGSKPNRTVPTGPSGDALVASRGYLRPAEVSQCPFHAKKHISGDAVLWTSKCPFQGGKPVISGFSPIAGSDFLCPNKTFWGPRKLQKHKNIKISPEIMVFAWNRHYEATGGHSLRLVCQIQSLE